MDSTISRIEKDFIEAYKAKEETRTAVLRLLKSSLKNMSIDKKGELSEEEVVKVLRKEIKQRRDSIEQYKRGGREDLAEKEAAEIKIIETYMPEQLDESKIRKIVQTAIAETGASSKADFGKVMGKVMPTLAGRSDGNIVSRIVSDLLSND